MAAPLIGSGGAVGRKEWDMSDLITTVWVRVSNALYREKGQAVTEYAVVLAVIVLIAGLVATSGIGSTVISKITTQLGKL